MTTHPLSHFLYCPHCAADDFEIHNEKSKQCNRCGFIYYANPSAAVAALIVNEKKELLVSIRGKDPAKGTLDLPGGFADMEESLEEALLRELEEELGIVVNGPKYLFSLPNLYLYSGMTIHTMDCFFLLSVGSSIPLKAQDDVAEVRWIALDKIESSDFGLRSIRTAIERLQQENWTVLF